MTILFIIINVLLIAFLAGWEWKKSAAQDTTVYWSALTLRLICGVLIGLLYTYYYDGGDTITLFNDGVQPTSAAVNTDPRSRFFVYIIRVVNIITHNNYWLTALWFSLFSFICSHRLVIELDAVFPAARTASRIALLFTPSVVFWTSGIMKESVAFGAVAMLVVYFLSYMRGQKLKWTGVLSIAVFLFLLLSLKYYWAGVLLPCMITAVVIQKIAPKKFLVWWFLVVFILLSLAVSFTHPNFYPERFLTVIVENHDLLAAMSHPENIINYYDLSPTWLSIAINSPWALWSGLFRPTIFEAQSLTTVAAGIENLFLLGLVLWKLRSIRMPAAENRLIVLAAVVYILVLCIFLALSTPNLGTLSRYRVGFLPFFVLMIVADHPPERVAPVFLKLKILINKK